MFYCNAEAAGFEPANRLRAVNCFRGSLLQPLGHASCYLYWDSVPNYLNSPDPLFKGAIRASGLSIAAGPSLLASSGPASDDALLLLFVVAGGFEAFGVLGYLELVDTFLDITVHEGREIVH